MNSINAEQSLVHSLRGELLFNEPLASYTSWHVGGAARQFYKPADVDDLSFFLKTLPADEKTLWLGLGSNLLIRDGGINGTVIFTLGQLKQLTAIDELTVRVQAGVPCAKLAKYCARAGLMDAAFFAGIPGTIGGALAMNAGAYGGETWQYVTSVETIDRLGHINTYRPEEFNISYREVVKPREEWFIAGHFRFKKGDVQKESQAIRELLRKRQIQQPIGEFSCGSVFRNPQGDYAARLIDACGLKGKRIGGAWVSQKHANFIINGGNATANDIEQLIHFIANEVKRVKGVSLTPEVHIVGETGEVKADENDHS